MSRPDEIGRLGHAFDAMPQNVATTRQQGDQRLVELTTVLEALRTSEAHYRTIVEAALDCIVTIDAHGNVVEFNPAAEKTFGYRKEEAVGRELAELIVPPEHRDAHRKGLARYLATGASTLVGQSIVFAQRPRGHFRIADGSPPRDSGRRPNASYPGGRAHVLARGAGRRPDVLSWGQ